MKFKKKKDFKNNMKKNPSQTLKKIHSKNNLNNSLILKKYNN